MPIDIEKFTQFIGGWIDGYDFSYQSSVIRGIKRFFRDDPDYIVEEEWSYSSFARKDLGRPFQCDVRIRNRRTGEIVCIIEVKPLYGQSPNLRTILYDLIRLESSELPENVERLFIVAGERRNERFLLGSGRTNRLTKADLVRSLLPLQVGAPVRVDFKRANPTLQSHVKEFARSLGIEAPKTLITELVSDCTTPGARVNVWRVAGKARRRADAVAA